jgi:Xaa-Pro dipeptidase
MERTGFGEGNVSNLQRLRDALRQQKADVAVVTDVGRVVWVSGHAGFIEKGPDPFAGGPVVALISGQDSVLVTGDASGCNQLQRTIAYTTYDYRQPIDLPGNWSRALRTALAYLGGERGTVGIDLASASGGVLSALEHELPHWRRIDIGPLVDQLRSIKTGQELESLRRACDLCGVGQGAARRIARPGLREIEVYSAIHASMEAAANDRIPLGADLISGERTLATEGRPGERVIRAGDLLLADLFPRQPDGYWGDSCSTFVVGREPSPELRSIQRQIGQAMEIGRALLRPGVKACEVDAAVRGHLGALGYEYPHHTGHGVGTSHFERPYIMPWNDETLENDMVITLEPGVYAPGIGGIRLEWVFRVTDSGGEPLSQFSLDIAQS